MRKTLSVSVLRRILGDAETDRIVAAYEADALKRQEKANQPPKEGKQAAARREREAREQRLADEIVERRLAGQPFKEIVVLNPKGARYGRTTVEFLFLMALGRIERDEQHPLHDEVCTIRQLAPWAKPQPAD